MRFGGRIQLVETPLMKRGVKFSEEEDDWWNQVSSSEQIRSKKEKREGNFIFDVIHNLHPPPQQSGLSSQEGFSAQMVNSFNSEDMSLHQSMDDQEMAEIRSVGEQHEMEWNDTLNLATSAWWFKFLKAMEIGPDHENNNNGEDDYGCYPFDEVMEFPAWLNANENCLQQHVDETYSHNFLQDPTLPCMDIEEIEGMDTEWLA